jgi:acetyl esterase/lipase
MDTNKFLLDVYKVVLENKKLKSITIFGDSAGGNFALILAQQIKVHKLRRPDNVILVSPALSFVKTKEAIQHFSNEVIFTEAFFYTLRE